MDSEGLIRIRELIKAKVFDEDGMHMGHLQDLAIPGDMSSPYVESVGVHLEWTDRVGDIELARRVEDVAYLIPWSEVTEVSEDVLRLRGKHPSFPVETAHGKWLVRRDILNEQMVDPKGNRIHRVDDVLIKRDGDRLRIAGLEVSGTLIIASPAVKRFIEALKKKFRSRAEAEMIPWESVDHVEKEAIVIAETFSPES